MATMTGTGGGHEAAPESFTTSAPESAAGQALGGIGPWLRLFLGISGGAVAIAVALGLLVVLTSTVAHARPVQASAYDTIGSGRPDALDSIRSHRAGGLILLESEGAVAAPLQSTDARLIVTGNTVRGTVTQRFRNPGSEWLEGTYLFPLPDDAAVDHLRMTVGDRTVEGRIQEKEAARRAFAQARVQGQRASLVEQERPNAFSTHVTNIAPGAFIEIELQYQQTLAMREGAWRLRLPGVVAPRYGSPVDANEARHPPRGFVLAGMQAEQADGMDQPVVPAGAAPLNPIRITVELDPGVPILQPVSASHRLQIARMAGTGDSGVRYRLQTIATAEAQEVADRDFELEWSPAAALLPMATLRHERRGDSYYGMLVVNPPSLEVQPGDRLPREMTFVVDTSGSMGGESIGQARSALAFGLERLQEGDWFNIIQFNSSHSSLFPAPRPVTGESLRIARRYLASLRADGGTEMRGAIAQALSAPLATDTLGQVVFITDGAVDYEDELISLVRERLGARRLFTVGIGSAPNGFFMRKAAEIGGGTFTFIGNAGEVERRMAGLFRKIAHPMSTNLAVTLDGGALAEPIDMPRDLYAGEPLILTARFSELPRAIFVSGVAGLGQDGAGRWRIAADLSAAQGSGLHVRWARSRIETLTDAIRQARHTAEPQDALRDRVVALALDHHLVSDYTSLVAVDLTPARPADAPMQQGAVPVNLPSGWSENGPAQARIGAPASAQIGAPALARTATPASLQLLIGLALLAVGFLLLVSRRCSGYIACGQRR